jgi:uncharacterized protein YlxW (UPF0749 family)
VWIKDSKWSSMRKKIADLQNENRILRQNYQRLRSEVPGLPVTLDGFISRYAREVDDDDE